MNEMIKALWNKLSFFEFGPWLTTEGIKQIDLLVDLLENISLVETYVYDYNPFISSSGRWYVRLNVFYIPPTTI